jgi:predicted exporter
MKIRGGKIALVSALWLLLALASLIILTFRLQLTFDLSAFFPRETSLTQEILLEQLKNGPGSRLIVIGLKGESRDQLAEISDLMKAKLTTQPDFMNVLNGEYALEDAVIPEPVKSYYLLLDDIDYSQASLEQALQQRQRDLSIGGNSFLLDLMARDPFLLTLKILESLAPVNITGDTWFAEDGSAVLLAETRAPAIDIAAQEQAITLIRQAFTDLPNSNSVKLELTGVGAFSVELQKTIRAEAQKRTILAMTALLVILLFIYRKIQLVLLAALPIGMGFLVGLASVALLFTSVHGITLAFGFTLMGVAIDYPLHLFSHTRREPGHVAIKLIWPTLRIGVASTAIAYLAIAFSGSDGLAQLGAFTASGVIVAALVTRYWLPHFVVPQKGATTVSNTQPQQRPLAILPALLTLLVTLLGMQFSLKDGLWDDRLSSLSPVPEQRLRMDGLLRSAAGTPDMRYQLVLHATSLENLLRDNEAVDLLLQQAADDHLLESWQSASLILPSQFLQKQRQDAIPNNDVLHSRLQEAIAKSPFREDAFELFEANAKLAKTLLPLSPVDFEATTLDSWLESHLIHVGDQWVSLISISQPKPLELASRLATWKQQIELVDLHKSSLDLMINYRNGAIRTIFFASLLIIALLLFEQKEPRRVLWIILTVMASLTVTVVVVTLLHNGLTIIHLVALLLVMGLGLDYALFVSRKETTLEQSATRHAVVACAITTTLTFGILAGSSIPMLKFIGLTIATGSAASFILAFVGSWVSKKKLS